MSTVYAGEHQTLRRPVAIKILHRQLVRDSVMARRMIGEAFTIAALHHPGIVGVLDVGVSEDGRAYVVMERLIGETLSARLRRSRLPEAKVLVFARQIASALAATHAAGVIHRDLKPDNLYVVPDPDVPGGERVKVLDFGIAWRDQVGRERTLTGVVLGTPSYMAPEQLDGSGDLDPRVDVFALGVVMYQMVTGALPFGGNGNNTEQLLIEQAYCAPTPAASLAPVSHALSRIIDRCLAKKPSERFTTMADLVGELGRTGLPIPAATSAFESEDTNPDMPEPLSDTVDEAAGEAVSTREHTARHVSRAPIPRRRRWIAPVAIAAAVVAGMFAAIVPRRAMRRDAAPEPAIEVSAPEVSRAEPPPPPPRRERVERVAPKPERVAPKAERIAAKPAPERIEKPSSRAVKPAPHRAARKPREVRETRPAPVTPPAPTGNQFAAVETPTLY